MDKQENSTNKSIDDIQFNENDLESLKKRNIFDSSLENCQEKDNENKKSVKWEIGQVSILTLRHSFPYIGKFLFLNFIVLVACCIYTETVTSMIINSLTFLGCLFFDQLISFMNLKDFDFIKMKKLCICVFVYIMTLGILNIALLIVPASITVNFDLKTFKITIGLILFSSTVSVLTEAIMNIPQQAMPTLQEKTSG